MSQPPQYYPYQPASDPYSAGGFDALLAPARRAGLLMIVLGALNLLCGICGGVMVAGADFEQILAQQELPPEVELTPGVLQGLAIGMLVVGLAAGIGAIVLGLLVRRGASVPVILSLVLTALVVLVLAFLIVAGTAAALMQGMAPTPICIWIIPLVLSILLLVWLIQAARNAGQIKAWQQQYQAQYWQQQPYGGGYGYQQPPGQGPPPPPPSGYRDPQDPDAGR
jgi:hypothetical protein